MSTRDLALDRFRRHPRLLKPTLMALTDRGESNIERVLADLQRDKTIRTFPYLGGKKLYSLTPTGARLLGLDWRKFRRAPTTFAIQTGQLIAEFCAREQLQLLTDDEFAEIA